MTIVKTKRQALPSYSHLFDDLLNTKLGSWKRDHFSSTDSTIPQINIKEDDNSFTVELAAPGMNKVDFNIELDQNLLTISSDKKEENQQEGKSYRRREFAYQSFQRSFTLPESANPEKIKARYTNGILEISIPKKEEAKPKPPKSISIS